MTKKEPVEIHLPIDLRFYVDIHFLSTLNQMHRYSEFGSGPSSQMVIEYGSETLVYTARDQK